MHSLPLFVALGFGLVGQAAAQVAGLRMSECQTRCYDMTAEMIGCAKDDAGCLCDKFKPSFWGQFTSCQIEGCAFEESTLTQQQLERAICAQAGQEPKPTASVPPETTPEGPIISTISPSGTVPPAPTRSTPGSTTSVDVIPSATGSQGEQDPDETGSPTPGGGDTAGAPVPLGVGVGVSVLLAAFVAGYVVV